jgi:DHA1 family bicyclomycin/chloramphenicol resistance-like MFS transporter
MALEPMGHIAGMAAAVSGSLSSLVAVTFGALAGRFYNGTMYPTSFAFLAFGLATWVFAEWAARHKVAQKSVP